MNVFQYRNDERINCTQPDPYPMDYITAMHITSGFTIFLNCLALYCIINKSSSAMKVYRWHLLVYQILSFATDIYATILVIPVLFLPAFVAYIAGVLKHFAIDTHLIITIGNGLILALSACVFELFFYRYQTSLLEGDKFKLSSRAYYTFIIVFFTACSLPFIYILSTMKLDQAYNKQRISEIYNCYDEVLRIPKIQVYLFEDIHQVVYLFLLGSIAESAAVGALVALTYQSLSNCCHSEATMRMHRKALIYLCIQISIPMLVIAVPVLYTTIVVTQGYFISQHVFNGISSLIYLHGGIGSICLLSIVAPYRKFILSPLNYIFVTTPSIPVSISNKINLKEQPRRGPYLV